MKQAKRALAVLMAALSVFLALPVRTAADEDFVAHFMIRFDVDSATTTYCNVTGQGGGSWGGTITGPGQVSTSGSSVTVTSAAAFGDLDADDIIFVNRALTTGVTDVRRVVGAPASTSSLTVDAAVDWSGGFTWRYLKQQCGTGVTAGWVDTSSFTSKTIVVQFNQGDITSLGWRVEGLAGAIGATPTVIYPASATACGPDGTVASGYCDFVAAKASFTTGTGNWAVQSPSNLMPDLKQWKYLRVGFKFVTADTSETTTNLESVTAYIIGSRPPR